MLEARMSNGINRRDFMKLLTAGTGSFMLAPWGLVPIPEKTIGTTTGKVADVPGSFPRAETVIIRQLTGRVGTPDNFNEWIGWKWRDRGTQNLGNEPLWSVDFATGKIINGVADGDPKYTKDFTSVTVALRKGVIWSDGQPFTAADVVFTVETHIKYEKFNAHTFFADNVKAVTAVDDYT